MSRNFDLALHMRGPLELPRQPAPSAGLTLVSVTGGKEVQWSSQPVGAGGSASLPTATRSGQVMVAGNGPSFDWDAGEIDMGRY
jgi:hypothetical protein